MNYSILRKLMLIAVLLTGSHAFAYDFVVNGIYYNILSEDDKTASVTGGNSKYMGDIVIPATVTNNDITYTVASIGDNAFNGCSGLTSITIPNSVKHIGIGAFLSCSNLSNLTIGNSVTTIGDNAFSGCVELTSITIPNSVTSIGRFAFAPQQKNSSIVVESGNTVYDSRGNCNAIIETATNKLVVGCSTTTIPNSVTSIETGAFVLYLAPTLTIPNSVTNIQPGAFIYCPLLTSIKVEDGNPKYDSRNNCNAIIKTATNELIKGCNNTIIPGSITYIGKEAFYECSGLTSVTIPNSVTSIGSSAFHSCSGLTSVTIPNSVTSIGPFAFANCSGLTSIVLGKSLTYIGECTFDCDNIIEIESLNSIAPSLGGDSFSYDTYKKAKVSVPIGALESYQNTVGWKKFKNIISNLGYKVFTNYNKTEGNITINGINDTYLGVEIDCPVEFIITPNAGYKIDKVTLNGKDITIEVVDGKYNIEKATEDLSLSVTFKKKSCSLIIKCSEAGAFKRVMQYGETATYEIVPSENWSINTVVFNGADVTADVIDGTFTTPEITEDSELSVVFVYIATSVYSLYNTSDIKVYASQQTIYIKGLEDNTPVVVFNANGQIEYSKIATDYEMNINMNKNGVYLVKVGERTFKVIL